MRYMAAASEEVRRRLQAELDDREGNMRRLAREIAANTDTPIERVRRMLYRLLTDGVAPTSATSMLLERGLNRPAGYFTVAAPTRDRPDPLAEVAAHLEELAAALVRLEEGQAEMLAHLQSLAQEHAHTVPAAPKRRH